MILISISFMLIIVSGKQELGNSQESQSLSYSQTNF